MAIFYPGNFKQLRCTKYFVDGNLFFLNWDINHYVSYLKSQN